MQLNQISSQSNKNTKNFFGLQLDQHLSWNPHICALSKKVSTQLFILNKVKNLLPMATLKNLYYALIDSQISYGIELWGNSPHINSITKLQKRAIRIINRESYKAHTEPLFKQSRILKITDLYKLKLLMFSYDYKSGHLPASFANFFQERRNINISITTRQENDFVAQRPRTNFSKNSVYQQTVTVWNDLPNELKTIPTRSQFKKALTSHFIDN